MPSNAEVIASMLAENTGRCLVDSGGEGGRGWQRFAEELAELRKKEPSASAVDVFEAGPAAAVDCCWGREIDFTISAYHWLKARVKYDDRLTSAMEVLRLLITTEEGSCSAHDLARRFPEWINGKKVYPNGNVHGFQPLSPGGGFVEGAVPASVQSVISSLNPDFNFSVQGFALSSYWRKACDKYEVDPMEAERVFEYIIAPQLSAFTAADVVKALSKPVDYGCGDAEPEVVNASFSKHGDVINTYNHEGHLDTILEMHFFEADGFKKAAILAHTGADARWGYSWPRIFDITCIEDLLDFDRGEIFCNGCFDMFDEESEGLSMWSCDSGYTFATQVIRGESTCIRGHDTTCAFVQESDIDLPVKDFYFGLRVAMASGATYVHDFIKAHVSLPKPEDVSQVAEKALAYAAVVGRASARKVDDAAGVVVINRDNNIAYCPNCGCQLQAMSLNP